MNESQLKVIVQTLIELRKENRKLLEEIRELKSTLLNENNVAKNEYGANRPIVTETIKNKSNPFIESKSPLASILSEFSPFTEEDEHTKSILDEQIVDSNDPVARVMNKIKNTDHKKVLQMMENASTNKFRNL